VALAVELLAELPQVEAQPVEAPEALQQAERAEALQQAERAEALPEEQVEALPAEQVEAPLRVEAAEVLPEGPQAELQEASLAAAAPARASSSRTPATSGTLRPTQCAFTPASRTSRPTPYGASIARRPAFSSRAPESSWASRRPTLARWR
jgi:hypothetical protein